MSEYSASALRDKNKEKARRMSGADPSGPVDGSSWVPPEPLDANVKTGMRPVSRQRFKAGGQVEGAQAQQRADRKPRKSGGLVNDFINRNDKDANEERAGIKHRGGLATGGVASEVPTQRFGFQPATSLAGKALGLKTGGSAEFDIHDVRHGNKRPKRSAGGILEALSPAYGLAKNPEVLEAVSPVAAVLGAGKKKRDERAMGGSLGTLGGFTKQKASGGRTARASGGATKGRTNINIIVSPGAASGGEPMPPAMPMGPPPGPPPMMPKPPMGGMPPGGPPIGAPPPGMPMPRKRGGRADAGAGSGLGRLEKIDDYGANAKSGEGK